ncbi:MAG: alpha/beta hydrolase [Eubacterium sp.]|nr:alpha/beta hydrolase [Eubacterium sp.]
MKKKRIVLIIIGVVAAVVLALAVVWGKTYYRAVDINNDIVTRGAITVKEEKEYYFFDGVGNESALIFYPGANIDERAYAPLMRTLALQGVDCYLLKMPLKFALFGTDRAAQIIAKGGYQKYFLAGHSLGGVAASRFADNNPESISALFLLASYPDKKMENVRFPVVFIYGNQDKILNKDKLIKGVDYADAYGEEIILKGANHAYFGSYGEQRGDGNAKITPKEQWKNTSEIILQF